ISRTLIDNERNIWFATLGEDVYKLISREVRIFRSDKIERSEVFSMEKYNGMIVAGGHLGNFYTVSNSGLKVTNYTPYFKISENQRGSHRMMALKRVQSGDL